MYNLNGNKKNDEKNYIMYREIDVTLLYEIIKIELYIHLSCFDKRS